MFSHSHIFYFLASSAIAAAVPLESNKGACSSSAIACKSSRVDNCCIPANGIIILAQQWLPGYCATENCQIDAPDYWTVHGGWPDTCSGEDRNDCSGPTYENISTLVESYDPNIYNNMTKDWISFKGDNEEFWSHEWDKHGRCYSPASTRCFSHMQDGQNLAKYFGYILALKNQFPVQQALEAANITSGSSYDSTDIRNSLTAAYSGMQVALKCTNDYLSEVWMALYATPKGGIAGAPISSDDTCNGNVNY